MRVMIVEDEALIALDLEMIMSSEGHDVIGEARCLREVDAMDISAQPDLALVDMHLDEGSTGIEASISIRDKWPGATIIFLTGNESRIPENFGGAEGVIGKPFSAAGLALAMRYLNHAIMTPPPPDLVPSALRIGGHAIDRWNG